MLTYFLSVCGLLLVIFVEPPNRFWAGSDEPSGDHRPTWLAIALLVGVLLIAFVPALSQLFDLRPVEPLDMVVVGVAAAAWVFLVRWARKRHLLERFLGTNVAR
jgi:cation-transporting ATPase E